MNDPLTSRPIATGKAADVFFVKGEPMDSWLARNSVNEEYRAERNRISAMARAKREMGIRERIGGKK
jgi:hypothetical protein